LSFRRRRNLFNIFWAIKAPLAGNVSPAAAIFSADSSSLNSSFNSGRKKCQHRAQSIRFISPNSIHLNQSQPRCVIQLAAANHHFINQKSEKAEKNSNCVHSPSNCVQSDSICVHSDTNCVQSDSICAHSSSNCVHSLSICVQSDSICVHSASICAHSDTICVRFHQEWMRFEI